MRQASWPVPSSALKLCSLRASQVSRVQVVAFQSEATRASDATSVWGKESGEAGGLTHRLVPLRVVPSQQFSGTWCRVLSLRRRSLAVLRLLADSLFSHDPQPGLTAWRRCWSCSARCSPKKRRRTLMRGQQQPATRSTRAAKPLQERQLQRCTSVTCARC